MFPGWSGLQVLRDLAEWLADPLDNFPSWVRIPARETFSSVRWSTEKQTLQIALLTNPCSLWPRLPVKYGNPRQWIQAYKADKGQNMRIIKKKNILNVSASKELTVLVSHIGFSSIKTKMDCHLQMAKKYWNHVVYNCGKCPTSELFLRKNSSTFPRKFW